LGQNRSNAGQNPHQRKVQYALNFHSPPAVFSNKRLGRNRLRAADKRNLFIGFSDKNEFLVKRNFRKLFDLTHRESVG